MKFRNLVATCLFVIIAAAVSANAQLNITGSVTGRVVTPGGKSVRRAVVHVLNLETLESQTRIANDFGYFKFNDLPILNLYMVSVESKAHEFTFGVQLVQFTALEHNLLFTSDN